LSALKREAAIKALTRAAKLRLIGAVSAVLLFVFSSFGVAYASGSAATDPRDSKSPYGVLDFVAWDHAWNDHHYTPDKIEKAADLMEKAGVGFIRMDFLWNDIEASRGHFNFDKYDRIVDTLARHNIKILGLLEYTPDWSGKKWNDAPPQDDYITYALETVRHFKDRVKYWEIWNEPDSKIYWNPQDDMKAYSLLLKETSQALKAEDPTCKIVMGGLSAYWPINLRKIYKIAGRESFDIVNIHPFTDPIRKDSLKLLKNNYLGVYQVMVKNGDADKPIWFTELGCPGTDNPRFNGWWLGRNPTEEEQAAWVDEVYGEPLRWKGVERIFWAFFRDTKHHFKNGVDYFGLVHEDFSPKPAYDHYKKATRPVRKP
jgi:hypothetical protein